MCCKNEFVVVIILPSLLRRELRAPGRPNFYYMLICDLSLCKTLGKQYAHWKSCWQGCTHYEMHSLNEVICFS